MGLEFVRCRSGEADGEIWRCGRPEKGKEREATQLCFDWRRENNTTV
jgi:hypothetical protein